MSGLAVQQMADRVAALLEEKLKVRGNDLPAKLRRGGRRLPRGIRAEAQVLADAAERAGNPKLAMRIDMARVTRAYDTCVAHLTTLDRGARRRAAVLDALGRIVLNLLLVAALTVAILVWRGFL